MDPPRPLVAVPEPMKRLPLIPLLELPELRTTAPLTPDVPALAVLMINEPLLVEDPYPVKIDTIPPLDDDDTPADNTSCPPTAESPAPTTR